MYEPGKEAQELERAVNQLGFCGRLVNDYPSIEFGWSNSLESDARVSQRPHPDPGSLYGHRPHLQGVAVKFDLDLSYHMYALCSSGELPRLQ
ncbi:unnamed protein product [Fusarium graminearum]|uniref:Uncharacterized protein n=1 Tax=Gibberella zeae TaxID=5518 RepID=A0A9N8NAY7_GIBZA|nr:unnamed protein product [Fusarium graminearum]